MQCPKCKKADLTETILSEKLPGNQCSECHGNWIRSIDYENWQTQQPHDKIPPQTLTDTLNLNYTPSAYDTKAALCPECRRYLSRAKVGIKKPFYVERCPECNGIWCDGGEWEILRQLGLDDSIEQLFSSDWQSKVKEQQQSRSERQALINKLGEELAQQIFAIAEVLQKHPHGDFGVAYLMRQIAVSEELRENKR